MKKQKFYNRAWLYLLLGLVVIVIGFSQSFFLRFSENSFSHQIHGVSATLWMTLLIIQPLLYALGKIKVHKKLGWVSLLFVPLLVLAGLEMMKLMIRGQEHYPPNVVYNLAFIDATTLLIFVLLFSLALYFRKSLKLHARFMVCTIFAPLVPALTRVYFAFGLAANFHESLTYSYILLELVLLLIIWKERKHPEIKYTYIPVFLSTALVHALMYFAGDWAWWQSAMNYFAGYAP